jgi:hypothetical protein
MFADLEHAAQQQRSRAVDAHSLSTVVLRSDVSSVPGQILCRKLHG